MARWPDLLFRLEGSLYASSGCSWRWSDVATARLHSSRGQAEAGALQRPEVKAHELELAHPQGRNQMKNGAVTPASSAMPAGAAEVENTESTPGHSTAAQLAWISETLRIAARALPLVLRAAHQKPMRWCLTEAPSKLMLPLRL